MMTETRKAVFYLSDEIDVASRFNEFHVYLLIDGWPKAEGWAAPNP